MSKITYDDLFALVEEMTLGAKDKTRTIDKVSNSVVRNLISTESNMALRKGVTASILAASGTTISSAMVGTIGGAGTGIVSTGLTTLGVTSLTASGGALAGGAAGSAVPIIGTIVGVAVGVGVGVFVGSRLKKKKDAEKERLMQEVQKKQNTIIRDLVKELNELKEKYGSSVEQNDRYKYIIGILMANEELKKAAA
ncbi:hypothetical protein [Acetoanaerobium noterae]|uniref:hypothetical protein n=1 Tax=Acetoanaerobium noterae TaxID=745369 RepID=UPI0033318D66